MDLHYLVSILTLLITLTLMFIIGNFAYKRTKNIYIGIFVSWLVAFIICFSFYIPFTKWWKKQDKNKQSLIIPKVQYIDKKRNIKYEIFI